MADWKRSDRDAIRRVINLRLKGAGIFWHKKSAEAVLLLRAYYKAGRWKNLENQVVKAILRGRCLNLRNLNAPCPIAGRMRADYDQVLFHFDAVPRMTNLQRHGRNT